jgi:glycosyltransferase involved in cell wall biosynthesis
VRIWPSSAPSVSREALGEGERIPDKRFVYIGPVPPHRGGIAHHGARLIEALRNLGYRVDVYSWAAQFPRLLYPGNERDPDADALPDSRFWLRWWSPASWWRVGRSAQGAALLVFAWVTPLQAPAYRVMLAAAGSTRSAAIVHNPVPHERRPLDRQLTRWVLGLVSGAVVHSESSLEEIRQLGIQAPVARVPFPPALLLAPTELPPAPPYRLLFFGFVRAYKGLDVAIDALGQLVRRGRPVRLTIAGGFWEPVEPWRQRIVAAGLQNHVELRPRYVPDQEVPGLLATHHVVLAPYRTATQSAIVPLAHAAGRPVVASRVGGVGEQVTDGRNGVLVPPNDPAALAEGIEQVLQHLRDMAQSSALYAPLWEDVARALVSLAE